MNYYLAASDGRDPQTAEARIVIGPNASLSVSQAWMFMGLCAATGVLIGAVMLWHGWWLVLPFTGLELGALSAGLYVSVRRNAYREVLVFGPERLRIEFGVIGRGVMTVIDLSRSQTRALVEAGRNVHEPNRLVLSCAGQRVRIATCLTDEERCRLAARIRQLLTPAWCAIPAGAGEEPAREWPQGD